MVIWLLPDDSLKKNMMLTMKGSRDGGSRKKAEAEMANAIEQLAPSTL
jgi:hypothetical protein